MKGKFYSLSVPKRFLIGLIAAIVGAGMCSGICNQLFAHIHSMDVAEYTRRVVQATLNLRDITLIQTALVQQAIVVFLVPAILLLYAYTKRPFYFIGITRRINIRVLGIFLGVMILFIPGINLLSSINYWAANQIFTQESLFFKMFEQNEKLLDFIVQQTTAENIFIQLFVMAIVPAITEEFFFRGMLQTYSFRVFANKHIAIFFAAAIFSILHADIYNFIPRTIMGCMYGYIFVWYGNLWIPIIAHFVHNASVVVILYYISQGTIPQSIETIGDTSNNLILGAVSILFVTFVSIRTLRKQRVMKYNSLT